MKHRILQVFEHHLMKSYDRVYENDIPNTSRIIAVLMKIMFI